jgi:hypothetical protein
MKLSEVKTFGQLRAFFLENGLAEVGEGIPDSEAPLRAAVLHKWTFDDPDRGVAKVMVSWLYEDV